MKPEFSRLDAVYMAHAIHLAERGLYTTDPNPRVGCVLVKEGEIIGEGWHRWAGQGHAEVEALRAAGARAKGATAYVTLEPCCHHGKTPPCSEALIRAGVIRVVAAMQDPNPQVSGRGLKMLQEAGVETVYGLLEDAARALNPGFCKRMLYGRPYVMSKLAMSLDGRTAMASGESRWITGEFARLDGHRLRARSSVIMTGVETVLADDPALTARLGEAVEVLQPLRVIVDSRLRTPPEARLAREPGKNLIFTVCADPERQARLLEAGFAIQVLASSPEGRVDLDAALGWLARQGVNEVLVEAGPVLNGALLRLGLVDEWVVYMAPCVFGDEGRGLFHLPGLQKMADRIDLQIIDVRRIGSDLRLRLRPAEERGRL